MFDVGFFELIVIAIIGLFVIGPERLPGAIRSVAMWVGRVRYFISETRSEFEKHIGADDIRRELHNEQVMRSLEALKKSKQDLEDSINAGTQNSILPPSEAGSDRDQDLPDAYPHDASGQAITGSGSAPGPLSKEAVVATGNTESSEANHATNSRQAATHTASDAQKAGDEWSDRDEEWLDREIDAATQTAPPAIDLKNNAASLKK
ncbi:MAG: Sec-independent protein translocase protein TatB [Cellvibrionaceae bacterium]|nr:Sec-independent protein translocase protein TatB [Cellvibrionaceae bacterium]